MQAMDRRRAAWGVALAFAAIGGLCAHLVAYSLAAPSGHQGHHGTPTLSVYGAHLRGCIAICVAIGLIALAVSALERSGRVRRAVGPFWLFAAAPPIGFVLQELLERAAGTGTLSHVGPLEAPFLVGLAVQIPFALAAYFAARGLLVAAAAFVRRLAGPPRLRLAPAEPRELVALAVATPRLPSLALGYGQRGPPS
jgi:hypothetical protein